jgi:hypothetical protein
MSFRSAASGLSAEVIGVLVVRRPAPYCATLPCVRLDGLPVIVDPQQVLAPLLKGDLDSALTPPPQALLITMLFLV